MIDIENQVTMYLVGTLSRFGTVTTSRNCIHINREIYTVDVDVHFEDGRMKYNIWLLSDNFEKIEIIAFTYESIIQIIKGFHTVITSKIK